MYSSRVHTRLDCRLDQSGLYCGELCCSWLYCSRQYCSRPDSSILYSSRLYFSELDFSDLCFIRLYCSRLYCNVLSLTECWRGNSKSCASLNGFPVHIMHADMPMARVYLEVLVPARDRRSVATWARQVSDYEVVDTTIHSSGHVTQELAYFFSFTQCNHFFKNKKMLCLNWFDNVDKSTN